MARPDIIVLYWTILQVCWVYATHVTGLQAEDCDSGWTYRNETRGCYKFFGILMDFNSARDHCAALGASIPTAKSRKENNILTELTPPNAIATWLGGNYIDIEGQWIWQDGSPFGWTNWYLGEPTNGRIYNCLLTHAYPYQSYSGPWYDASCSAKYHFFCLVTDDVRLVGGDSANEGNVEVFHNGTWGTVCDEGWDDYEARVVCRMTGYSGGKATMGAYFGQGSGPTWNSSFGCNGTEYTLEKCPQYELGKHNCTHAREAGVKCADCEKSWAYSDETRGCYKLFRLYQRFPSAKDYCESLGAFLTSSRTPKENKLLLDLTGSSRGWVWLGGEKIDIDGHDQWTWQDGTPFGWTNWAPGAPNGTDRLNCTFMDNYGMWIDTICSGEVDINMYPTSLYFICSRTVPAVTDVSPRHGPLSGGTKLIITVTNLSKGQLKYISIGEHILVNFTWASTGISLKTSKGSKILQALTIKLKLTGGTYISAPYTFTYKPDPLVTNIYPLNTITSGGTKLTVEGQYLDSVGEADLQLTLSPKDTEAQTTQLELNSKCDKDALTYSKMVCQTPNTTGYISQDNIDFYALYIGLKLDGVPTYQNLLETLPQYARLNVFPDPTFYTFEEKIIESGKYLSIEGESMDKGCTKEDYIIIIGNGTCRIEQLLRNALLCLPPDTQPGQTPNEVLLGEKRYYLLVQVGFSVTYQLGVVRYSRDNTVFYVIIGCSVTGAVVIILFIIICVFRRIRHKPGTTSARGVRDGEDLSGEMDATSGETKLRLDEHNYPLSEIDMGKRNNLEQEFGYPQPMEETGHPYRSTGPRISTHSPDKVYSVEGDPQSKSRQGERVTEPITE